MNPADTFQYFQYHNANMRLLKIGYDQIRNQIKRIYKSKNKAGDLIFSLADTAPEKVKARKIEKSFSRMLSGIQVSWAEESIKRLLYESNVFTDGQRDYLLEQSAFDQRWYKTLHITFCIAYDLVPVTDPNCETVNIRMQRNNLGVELVNQYLELKRIITDFLVPNFSIRNKVQHGEWEYAFKPSYSKEFSADLTVKIDHENIVTTTSRYTLVNAFYQMLVDLGRFKSNAFALDSIQTPFEYFYKHSIRKIRFETQKIADPRIDDFITNILAKEIRGADYRHTY